MRSSRYIDWIGTCVDESGDKYEVGIYSWIGEGIAYIYVVDNKGIPEEIKSDYMPHASDGYERFEFTEIGKAREFIKNNKDLFPNVEFYR